MEVGVQLYAPASLPPEKEPPVPTGRGGRMVSGTGIDAVAKKKIPSPSGNLTPVVQPIA